MRIAAVICAAMALQSFAIVDHPELSAELATQVARELVRIDGRPAPKPVSGKCKNCNGTGKVGDGKIVMTCLVCKGTGKELVSVLVKPRACTTGRCPL